MSKTTLQKVYEKMTLIQQNPEDLCLMCVWDNDKPALALGLRDGQAMTPLAIMLDQQRCDGLVPDWNNFDEIQAVIAKAQELEDRTKKSEFDMHHSTIDKIFAESPY